MLAAQDGKCAICDEEETDTYQGKPKMLAVDHCHSSGRVRALLCSNCNNVLGRARDRIDILEAAIRYLKEYGT